ncbi:MAG TPA: 3-oxoacyl-ACP reductase FabG [Kofleriaceae bacterium]
MTKVALVTGASRGIGAAIARQLARDGFELALTCMSRLPELEQLATELGVPTTLAQFDVRDPVATRDALARFPEIHVVVNNAGVAMDGVFPGLTPEQWHRVIDTTLDGFFNVTQPLIMPMTRRKWGRIINIASLSGIHGNRGQVNYAAAKAGLIGATKSLALELASRNITVNAVAPGLIDTEMLAGAPVAELRERIPMKRLGTAQEVADLVSYLASDKAAYMTGQVLTLSGGL